MLETNLWGEEFSIKKDDINKILKKSKKAKELEELSIDKKLSSKYVPIIQKIDLIKNDVYRILGKFINDTIVIRDYQSFKEYIDQAINQNIIAIDTETNNTLDVFGDCKLMGLCLYTPGRKNAYIPVNHCHYSIETDEKGIEHIVLGDKLDNQISEEQIAEQLNRLTNTFTIFHNAVFDIEVLQQTTGVKLHANWDSAVGAAVLDENELKALKYQYRLHIDPSQEKYDIEHLFKGFQYAIFDPELFALYAATDSFLTYKLYEWQKKQFELPENKDIYKVFKEIEMPILDVVVNMETTGICINNDYASNMSTIYHAKSDAVQKEIEEELKQSQSLIDAWKLTPEANERKKVYVPKKTSLSEEKINAAYPLIDAKGNRYKWASKSPLEKLSDPIDLDSSEQLAIYLYDILKVPSVSHDSPRGTGKEILDQLADEEHIKICELIKKKRGIDILLDTFIDAIPMSMKSDGKVHARFDSIGTKTLRFSSKSPNLQNIPSHDKTVRMIFKPSCEHRTVEYMHGAYNFKIWEEIFINDKYIPVTKLVPGDTLFASEDSSEIIDKIDIQNYDVLIYTKEGSKPIRARTQYAIIGGDFSGQEPRSLCAMSQDKIMQEAYINKQDLYASVAAQCFHNNYTDNLEFVPQPDGSVIQSQEGKARRSKAKTVFLGINYGMSANTLAKRMELPLEEAQSIIDAYYGGFKGVKQFTEDSQKMAREKGYVTDIFGKRRRLPDATLPKFSVIPEKTFDKFNPLIGSVEHEDKILSLKIKKYEERLEKARTKNEREAISFEAKKEGFVIRNNGAFISRALRQTLNARIQGTASSMTKIAMILINNDEELNNLGARLLVTIHDEVFCEAPFANREKVAQKLCELMVKAAKVRCSFTPWSVDPYIVVDGWYEDENMSKIHETYEKLIKKGLSNAEALKATCDQYLMFNKESIALICHEKYEIGRDSLVNGPDYFIK